MEAEIVKYLSEKWDPEVILLGGSRALGTAKLTSDWDLYLIGAYPERESRPERFQGVHLDVELRGRSEVPAEILRIYYGPVRALRVLRDNADGLGAGIVSATEIAYKRGPTPRSPELQAQELGEMLRMIEKVHTYVADPDVCFYHLGIFYRLALQHWFETKDRWSLPPHEAVPVIRAEDPTLAAYLGIISGPESCAAKLSVCETIKDHLWAIKSMC